MLMLILVYARTQIDPVKEEDFSLYSLRRPIYPIAKPELNNEFQVSIADQQRYGTDLADFMSYMDVKPMNFTIPINAT